MSNKEAVVLVLDAGESMGVGLFTDPGNDPPARAPRTRFDCAKEAGMAILSDLMVRSKTNEATVVVLHTERTNNFFFREDEGDGGEDHSSSAHCPFPNITEFSGNGEVMGIRQPLPGLLRRIHGLKPGSIACGSGRGDFESGLVYAADALYRRTEGKRYRRRIVLVTDAEHRIGSTEERPRQLLVALEGLRAMDCSIQVVGMDFVKGADFGVRLEGPSEIEREPADDAAIGGDGSGGEGTDDDEDDDEDDDCTPGIKRANEEYLLRIAHATGGFVYASRDFEGTLAKVLGPRAAQNPTKRKLIVELAPGLVLEDARYYKLLTKTGSLPLTKKLAEVDDRNAPRKNAEGREMLQDYETITTHWNAEDENEELQRDRTSYAYRFGSDLLPFSPLDEAGLIQRSPVKLTVLGYKTEESVPEYLRVGPPYVLSGDESRRCCAAISALARALHRTKQVAVATFVKGVDKDPILCGLFPLLEPQSDSTAEPLRLVILQLPFAGDVRYPILEDPADIEDGHDPDAAAEACCDDLIDSMMLPGDALDYRRIPDHRVRSLYKTVVGRVLDKNSPVVPTRTDPSTGVDSIDTPPGVIARARPAVEAFYERFRLSRAAPDEP